MLNKLHHIHSLSKNPYVNLAFESYLLDKLENDYLLFTFVDGPCVVFGNFQNPWKECNLLSMKENSVLAVRRFSGGGAVYHDSGNLNLSFLRPVRDHAKNLNSQMMCEFLTRLELPVFVNERSDLRIKSQGESRDRKISGSAFKQKKDRSYHHMTLLCTSDLVKLNHYLRSDFEEKISSKSINSVRSQVANLSEYDEKMTPDFIAEKLKESCLNSKTFSEEEILKIPEVKKVFTEMQDFEFIFSKTPKMEVHFETSSEEYHLEITKGRLTNLSYLKSSIHPAFLEELFLFLKDKRVDELTLSLEDEKFSYFQDELLDFKNFLKKFFP